MCFCSVSDEQFFFFFIQREGSGWPAPAAEVTGWTRAQPVEGRMDLPSGVYLQHSVAVCLRVTVNRQLAFLTLWPHQLYLVIIGWC